MTTRPIEKSRRQAARLLGVVLLGMTTGAAIGRAQTPVIAVPQSMARAHLISAPPARYPMIALAAKVSGVVLLEVDISAEGGVTDARILDGIPMLDAAAQEAVLSWRFAPFTTGGQAAPVRTVLTLYFGTSPLPDDVAKAFIEVADTFLLCTIASEVREFTEARQRCATATAAARRLSPSSITAVIKPLLLEAEAEVELGLLTEAHPRFQEILDLTRRLVSSLQRGLAFRGLGRTSAAAGDTKAALDAFQRAERELIAVKNRCARNSPQRATVLGFIRAMAPHYAAVLEQTGRAADATKVRARLEEMQ